MNELKATGELGPPPLHLTPKVKRVWQELQQTIPPGLAASCDRWVFELLVCLMAKFRDGQAKGGETKQIESLLCRLGLTPSDRNRVSVTPPRSHEDDAWGEIDP